MPNWTLVTNALRGLNPEHLRNGTLMFVQTGIQLLLLLEYLPFLLSKLDLSLLDKLGLLVLDKLIDYGVIDSDIEHDCRVLILVLLGVFCFMSLPVFQQNLIRAGIQLYRVRYSFAHWYFSAWIFINWETLDWVTVRALNTLCQLRVLLSDWILCITQHWSQNAHNAVDRALLVRCFICTVIGCCTLWSLLDDSEMQLLSWFFFGRCYLWEGLLSDLLKDG